MIRRRCCCPVGQRTAAAGRPALPGPAGGAELTTVLAVSPMATTPWGLSCWTSHPLGLGAAGDRVGGGRLGTARVWGILGLGQGRLGQRRRGREFFFSQFYLFMFLLYNIVLVWSPNTFYTNMGEIFQSSSLYCLTIRNQTDHLFSFCLVFLS